MTDPERTEVAEKLVALIFSLRPDNGPTSQAWVLSVATMAMARAILASANAGRLVEGAPSWDAGELLTLAHQQLVTQVRDLESQMLRARLMAPAGPRRPTG